MRVLGLLALGGAMGLNFEDLGYNKLKSAFSKVSSHHMCGQKYYIGWSPQLGESVLKLT